MTSATTKQPGRPPRLEHVLQPGIPVGLAAGPGLPEAFDDSYDALLVVCDGARGNELPHEIFELFSKQLEALRAPAAPNTSPFKLLQQATQDANQRAYQQGHRYTAGPMRVGLTALLIVSQRAYIANVGGGEIYVIRNGRVRSIFEADRSPQAVYVGDLPRLAQLATTGRPDFFHSAVVDLAIGDRLVLCTAGLVQHLAPSGSASAQQRAAEAGARALTYNNPTRAALTLTDSYQSATAQVLWRPLRSVAPAARPPQPVSLQGGAIVLLCADARQVSFAKYRQQRLQSARFVFTFLALLIVVSGLLAGAARVSAVYQASTSATQTAAASTAQAAATSPQSDVTPTATALVALVRAPEPTLPGIVVSPRPSRTPTVTRAPTETFTPSPVPPPPPKPTSTPPPPTPCLLSTPGPNAPCALTPASSQPTVGP